MEMIDVLDQKGCHNGKVKSKDEVHRDGDWHATVQILLINAKGEFLIQKRAPSKKSHPNDWSVSCAGHISAGDNNIQTSIRELEEELGVRAQPSDISFLFFHRIEHFEHGGRYINRQVNHIMVAKIDIPMDRIRIDPSEVSEVRFVSFDALSKSLANHDLKFDLPPEEFLDLIRSVRTLLHI